MAGEKKKRPAKRKIVRWDENLNELLLLSIQSVCNKEGIKIPWTGVANTMGNDITEGAVVQHLAKLRARRVEANKAVPPPLRRGGSGAAASSKSSEILAPPSQNPNQEQAQKSKQLKKRAISDDEDSDSDWEASRRSNNGSSKHKKSQKKRTKGNEQIDVDEIVDSEDGDLLSETEMVAVDAPFLKFLGNGEDDKRTPGTTDSEDEAGAEEKQSLVLTLKPGKKNLSKILHKGIGVYHERDPEKRWRLPAPGSNGETWGFSKDYYGPIPTSYSNLQTPGLLQGEWPQGVVTRQYKAPQPVSWADETHNPDPKIVHPANWLEDEECEPQLKFHRKLRTTEQSNSIARVLDEERPGYKEYVEKHRELPTYFDPSWNTAPTLSVTDNANTTYSIHDFSTGYSVPADQGTIRRHSDFDNFSLAQPQLDEDPDKSALVDDRWVGPVNKGFDDNQGEMPPGKTFDLDRMFSTEDIIDEAKNLVWWQD